MQFTTLITGATGRVGSALVTHFLAKGHCVVAHARRQESADDLSAKEAAAIRENRLHVFTADFEQPGAAAAVVSFLDSRGLSPVNLVNNARSLDSLKVQENGTTSADNLVREFRMAVVVPYEVTMALVSRQGGHLRSVVNVSSMYGLVAPQPSLYDDFAHQSPIQYGIAKAAQNHLSKELSVRLAANGIRVNTVSFGGIAGRASPEFEKRYARFCPAGRMLTVDEVAAPVEFLLSDASSGMTGHNMVVDGGWTTW